MKVYVLSTGCYENRGVLGIYDTPERAMAAGKGSWTKETVVSSTGREDVSWRNDLDWDDAADVYEYELESTGPERAPSVQRVQVYRPLDGGWAYVPESPEALRLARDANVYMERHRRCGVWREPEATEVDRRIAHHLDTRI